jgi:hypothetical protein
MDPEATRPLMDWLFTRTYDYPLPLSGIADYMISGTTREGTTTIGSFSYTASGTPFLKVASSISDYVNNGGDKKYNLADPKEYPKPFASPYFNLDARVAGYWRLGVGDVGGLIAYARDFDNQKEAVRIDAEWEELEKAAATVPRNPWMTNRSRALSAWSGILEGGTQHNDFRFRRAVTVRTGLGWGHSHRDTLDLQYYALGCQMTPDGGQRPGYGRPNCVNTHNHNLVVVDGSNWEGHAWTRMVADMPGSEMLHAKAIPPLNVQQVNLAERTVALLGIDEGKTSAEPPSNPSLAPGTTYGKDVVLPKTYVFDVYRVQGGKRHAYSFHGCAEDEFTINAIDKRDVPLRGKAKEEDADAAYLSGYEIEGYQGAGDAGDVVVATWRMGREGFTFEVPGARTDEGKMKTYTCPRPEQTNLGNNYNPDAPRKYTRLHLLGQKGARLRWGRWISAAYGGSAGQWFTKLHAVQDSEDARVGVFPAIIEAYEGEPGIESVKLLDVVDNSDDVNRAVAVEVKTFNGNRDILFADGHEDVKRTVNFAGGTMQATGRYAYYSADAEGLRQCSLSNGTEVNIDGAVALRTTTAAYRGTIKNVSHPEQTFEIDATLPAKLIGRSYWDISNPQRGTSCEVSEITPFGTESRLHFRKGFEVVRTRVKNTNPETGIVKGVLVSILMGAEEDNGMKPGMTNGLWATNDKLDKWWSCEYLGGSRDEGYDYKLTGAPVTAEDFPRDGEIRIYELGATDIATLATFASVRRHQEMPDAYEVTANVACGLELPAAKFPKGAEYSDDGTVWKPMKTTQNGAMLAMTLDETILDSGSVLLRAAK